MKHKITIEKAREIFHDDLLAEDPYQLVELGHWDDHGKYQSIEVVFSFEGRNYIFDVSRSGSYFTDYDYDFYDLDCAEVQKVEVTTTAWVPV